MREVRWASLGWKYCRSFVGVNIPIGWQNITPGYMIINCRDTLAVTGEGTSSLFYLIFCELQVQHYLLFLSCPLCYFYLQQITPFLLSYLWHQPIPALQLQFHSHRVHHSNYVLSSRYCPSSAFALFEVFCLPSVTSITQTLVSSLASVPHLSYLLCGVYSPRHLL